MIAWFFSFAPFGQDFSPYTHHQFPIFSMKKLLTTCTALFTVLALFGQSSAGFWGESNRNDFAQPAFMPQAWRALSLDLDAMRNYLRQAPMEFTAAAQNQPLELSLPMPDGSMEVFSVWESPIMEPALADKYPMIKTFAGRSNSNPSTTLRFDYSPQGFNAIVHTGTATVLVVPNSPTEQVYLSFWLKDVDFTTPEANQYHCEVKHSAAEMESFTENFIQPTDRASVPVDLYTYRLAVATTSEYSQDYGDTPATVLANVTTVINNVNSVFERDAAVRLVLIANTEQVFHYSNPDPYTNGNTGDMIDENPPVLNAAFTVNGYDIGHVFGTNGGGLANLAGVCNGEGGLSQYPKARAASCKFGPYDGPLFYIIAGHEMGHQFNATHTFNSCDNENETPETGYEPGSGSTLMCYNGNGVCGNNHVQPTSDPFFHVNSMLRIQTFTRTGGGNTCKPKATKCPWPISRWLVVFISPSQRRSS
jgi:Metallo-peptidase family M12B Reprolysin-like